MHTWNGFDKDERSKQRRGFIWTSRVPQGPFALRHQNGVFGPVRHTNAYATLVILTSQGSLCFLLLVCNGAWSKTPRNLSDNCCFILLKYQQWILLQHVSFSYSQWWNDTLYYRCMLWLFSCHHTFVWDNWHAGIIPFETAYNRG